MTAEQLKSIDKAAEGIQELEQSVLSAIADQGTGWFGARIKITNGTVTNVQVTSDKELHGQKARKK